jgi:adenine phosphoribosyltransferase
MVPCSSSVRNGWKKKRILNCPERHAIPAISMNGRPPLTAANADLAALIRTIPDFPKPGIQFRDITTLLLDPEGFRASIERLAASAPSPIDLVAGIEARGFIFSSALAAGLGKGLVLIRKDGKLPGATIGVDYALEYGSDRVVMHEDACVPGQRVLLVDDLIATGGTALAAVRLLRQAGAEVVGASFVIDLPDLRGAERLRAAGVPVATLVSFVGD